MSHDGHHPHSYPPIEGDAYIATTTSRAQQEPLQLPKSWPQYLVALSATFGGIIMGSCIGWSGPALHMLLTNSSDSTQAFHVSENEANFIASLMPAGALFGGLIGGFLISRLGRKGTMIGNSAFFALSFLCLVVAQNVWMLLTGRFFCGMASGITTIATPTYVSEIASPKVRGMLGSCFQLMVTVGVLYVGVVGAFVNWRWLSVACLALCVIWGLLLLPCPESPAYLLMKRNHEEAKSAMQFIRGHSDVDDELVQVQESIEEANGKTFSLTVLFQPVNRRPLMVALMLMVGQQLSGVNAVIFFSVTIFSAAKTQLNSLVENIIIGGAQVVATAAAAIMIDKLGRRILLTVSALVMILSLYGLGLYFYLLTNHPVLAAKLDFLPLASLCLFIMAFSVGFGPIPWLMMSEIFSPDVRSITTSISASFNWTLAFFVTEFFGPVSKAIGTAYTFWVFAAVLFLVMTFTLFCVPETKGQSLEEIQHYFKRANRNDDNEEVPILDDNLEATIEAEVNAEINTVRT